MCIYVYDSDIVIKVFWISIVAKKLEEKSLMHVSITNGFSNPSAQIHGLTNGKRKLRKADSPAIFN